MNDKQKEQLNKLNDKEKQRRYRNLTRWHSPDGKTINLSHILHTARATGIHGSKELQGRIEKIYRYNPQYKRPKIGTDTVSRALVMLGVFHLLGYLPTPLYPYIMYLLYSEWKTQGKIRNSRRRQKELMYYIDSFHLISKILEEAQRWIDRHPDELQYITPKYNKAELEELKKLKGEALDGNNKTTTRSSQTERGKASRII